MKKGSLKIVLAGPVWDIPFGRDASVEEEVGDLIHFPVSVSMFHFVLPSSHVASVTVVSNTASLSGIIDRVKEEGCAIWS